MQYGFVLPGGSARDQLELSIIAEENGWDGVFVWEGAYGVDAWSLLAAMAQRTSRVRLGTMLTPLPWRRPWKVASQAVTLDELSGGRATLAVGLGYAESGIGNRRDITDRRVKAELLDEGIDIVVALWNGELSHKGVHFDLDLTHGHLAELRPVQKPRIPIWVVGAWPSKKSMKRVLRCDGLLPTSIGKETTPNDIREMTAWLDKQRGPRSDFDVVIEGETPTDNSSKAADIVRPWSEVGCTWWLETRWELPHHTSDRRQQVTERIHAGPPRTD